MTGPGFGVGKRGGSSGGGHGGNGGQGQGQTTVGAGHGSYLYPQSFGKNGGHVFFPHLGGKEEVDFCSMSATH